MMSRITLNMKKSVHKMNRLGMKAELPSMFTQRSHLTVQDNLKIMAPGFGERTTGLDISTFGDDILGSVSQNDVFEMPTIKVPQKPRESEFVQAAGSFGW